MFILSNIRMKTVVFLINNMFQTLSFTNGFNIIRLIRKKLYLNHMIYKLSLVTKTFENLEIFFYLVSF